jgi:DHA1 family inner membrane transport protein
VLLALAMVVLGCGGLFTFSTYIAPMTTQVTGWPPAAVPVQLALLGLGMTAGTFLGGRLAR